MRWFFNKYLILVLFWCSTVLVSLAWNLHDHERNTRNILIDRGRSLFGMVLMHRQWNAEHGGVYVPLSETSQPNPYLIDPLREITCTGGLELTKINPAYMTRQLSMLSQEESSVHFHITSLSPVRPGNMADNWETGALRSFKEGIREKFELLEGGLQSGHYRYMAPLYTDKSCLKCHAEQGYVEGDVRGGISVAFDAEEISAASRNHMTHMTFVHMGALMMGFLFISLFAGYSRKADRKLQDERNRFQELVELTDAIHWEVDIATLRFTYISPQVEDLLGYPAEDWKDFDYWVSRLHPEDREWAPPYCMEHTARSEDHIFTYRSIAADGRVVWIRDIVSVVTDDEGRPVTLRGLLLDDTELKSAEEKLKLSIREKEVLMREIHHRVKNNMAVITSLQSLQANRLEDGPAKEALTESMNRIRSMALVHERIYESEDLASLDVSDYLESLTDYMAGYFGFPRANINIDVEAVEDCQDLDVLIPMGLIINELVTNSLKHAFDDKSKGMLVISLKCDEAGEMELIVSDNGRGMPDDMDPESTDSLGLLLVRSLVKQLDGNSEIRREGGTAFHIRFHGKKKA